MYKAGDIVPVPGWTTGGIVLETNGVKIWIFWPLLAATYIYKIDEWDHP